MSKYAIVKFLDEESPLLSDFFATYRAYAATYKTRRTIVSLDRPTMESFAKFVGNPRLLDITEQRCGEWVAALKAKLQLSSVRTRIVAMRAIFNYAIKTGVLSKNPLLSIKLPPPKFAGKMLSDKELETFLAAIKNPLVRRACKFAAYTGLRSSEIVGLEWWQVRDDSIVIPAEKSKSKRERVVLLSPRIRAMLKRRGSGKVFGFHYDTLRRNIAKASKILGLGHIRFHDMRHNWASRYFQLTKDPWAVMDAGGWANEISMRPYQHMTRARQEQIYGIRYAFDRA